MCFKNFCVHSNVISVFAQVLRKLNDIVFCVIVAFVEKLNVSQQSCNEDCPDCGSV